MTKEFLKYIFTRTNNTIDTKTFKIKDLISIFFFSLFLDIILLIIFSKFIGHIENRNSIISSMSLPKALLISAIAFPLIEEIIFRLWLKKGNYNHYISIITCLAYTSAIAIRSGLTKNIYFISTILIIALIIAIHKFIPQEKKYYFKISLCISTLMFGFMHLFNFVDIQSIEIYKLPILVIPQIVLGFISGYIRLTRGFKYGVLFHALHNFTIILITTLK